MGLRSNLRRIGASIDIPNRRGDLETRFLPETGFLIRAI